MPITAYNFDLSTARRVVRQTRNAEARPINREKVAFRTANTGEMWHAKVTAKTAINGGIRFKYTIELGYWDMASSPSTGGTWVATSGSLVYYAFNSAEDRNAFTSGTGRIGTGNTSVAESDGTIGSSSCKLLPFDNGDYCVVTLRGYDPAATQLYFTIINFANSAQ